MGTVAWENWRAYDAGEDLIEQFEDELHSDISFTGQPAELGPYKLSLVHRQFGDHGVGASLVLEGNSHTLQIPDIVVDNKIVPTDTSNYFGGALADEIAALVSLELGVRLRFAGIRMMSGFHQNPRTLFAVPPLGRPGAPTTEMLPYVMTRKPNLNQLALTKTFSNLAEKDERAVVRAATSYASAIWWANQDPGQAWLQFVTALEVASKHRQARKYDPAAIIAQVDPDLWSDLLEVPEPTRTKLAKKLAGPLRATQTFKTFVASHAPDPPAVRGTWEQLDWDAMEQHAGIIYKHRSDWLHKGIPLPLPLIDTRTETDPEGTPAEVPMGHSVGGRGGIWTADEYPMTLSMFEHITRGALLKWWQEL